MFPSIHGVVSQGGVALPPDPGEAYRYYRLLITANNGNAWVGVSELELRTSQGGPNVAPGSGGTASASNAHASYPASNAFDGDPETTWQFANNQAWPQWIRFDFGAGNEVAVAQYAVRAARTGVTRTPSAWTFEGSQDGVTWTELDQRSGQTGWVVDEVRAYSL